jgi:hypothetical protein
VRFDEASLGRFEPKTNPTRGKAREKPPRHPHGELLLDNADAVIDALHLLHTHLPEDISDAAPPGLKGFSFCPVSHGWLAVG